MKTEREKFCVDTINEVYEYLGYAQLIGSTKLEFNKRFNVRCGDALYNPATRTGRIRIGEKYWNFASESDKVETLRHEACHIINQLKLTNNPGTFNRSLYKQTGGHESNWISLMQELGYKNPSATYCGGYFGNHYVFSCPSCLLECKVSVRHGNLYHKEGRLGRCRKCNTLVNYKNFVLVKEKIYE